MMNTDKIDAIIAERCGWKRETIRGTPYNSLDGNEQGLEIWRGPDGSIVGHGQMPPPFSSDLNWMAHARGTLSPPALAAYGLVLHSVLADAMLKLTGGDRSIGAYRAHPRCIWDASALEHAETFIKSECPELWEE